MNEKQVVKEFCDQYCWLRVVRDEYYALYEGGPGRIELLKEVASGFFPRLSHMFVQYLELRICCLTDPPGRKGRKNLSVKYIIELIGAEESKRLGLDVLSDQIHAIRQYVVKGRNKGIAHLDCDALVSSKIFNEYPREVWDQFWESLGTFVDEVHMHCFGSIIGDVHSTGGAEDLVEALKKAVYFKDYFTQHPGLWTCALQNMRYKDA